MKRSELLFTFLLIPLDLLMIVLSYALAYYLRTFFEFVPIVYVEPLREYLKFALMTLPLWLFVFICAGLYAFRERSGKIEEFGKILVATTAAVSLVMVWLFLSRTFFFSRLIIIYVWLIALFLVTLGRALLHLVQKWLYYWEIGVHRVMILGKNPGAGFLSAIKKNRSLGYKLVKVIDEGAINSLGGICAKNRVDEIIIADSHLSQTKLAQILDFCRQKHLGFKMTPDLFLVASSKVEIETLADMPILEFKRSPLDGWGRIIKRMIDLGGAIILIILTSPLMFLTALLVKLASPGPILFRQERVGLDHNFTFYKFRTMQCGAEREHKKYIKKYGLMFKLTNDPRLTSVGKFLRKTSLDELPQFFNVLTGDMSLIGPRPPMPEEVARYNKFQRRRLGLKPGITGLWQVSGRSDLSFEEWVKLDAFYIEHWSLWLDFQILLKTLWVVIWGRGAY